MTERQQRMQLFRRDLLKLGAGSLLVGAAGGAAASQGLKSGNEPVQSLALEPGLLLRWDTDGQPRLERRKHVLIRNEHIEAIQDHPFPSSIPRLDMGNCLLVPGFISGHTHVAAGSPTRGTIESGRGQLRPLELVDTLLSDDELDALTAFNLAELLLSGCTTQLEMSCSLRQTESYVRVASRWGARGYPGVMIPSIPRMGSVISLPPERALSESEAGNLAEIERFLSFARPLSRVPDSRLRPMTSFFGCDMQTPASMRAIVAAAKELGTGVHTHLAWHPGENPVMRQRWNMTSAQWCESFGLFDGPFFAAHFAHPDWAVDAPILRRHGAVYAHCPSVGGAGGPTQPYPEALGHGLKVNIGIDTHANDYLENLKLAVLLGQARYHLLEGRTELPLQAPTISDAVLGATLHPAQALRRGDLGRIEEGAQADLVAIDVSGFQVGTGTLPPEPLHNLLYASGSAVRHVMTGGILQVRDGRLLVDDERQVREQGGAAIRKLWDALEREGWFAAS